MSTPAAPTRAAAGMGAATLASRSIGLVRVVVVAAVLGTTYLGNTFQATNSVSNVLFELVAAGALSAVLVPTFVARLDAGDEAGMDRLAGSVLGVGLFGLGIVTVLGVVAAPALARLLTATVDDPVVAAQQQQLATFLLRWFVPQVLLYAFGAVATALLYARRRFAVTAAAPIGNTVVMVTALVVFRVVAGPDPGMRLDTGEQLLLAVAGTGGVAAFVGILVVASRRAGSRLRPRWGVREPEVRTVLGLAGWGVLLHANAGLLLAGALVLGNGVAGGVVAYQTAFVFFLAPYAVLAQPVHTTVLPELARAANRGEQARFAAALDWALDSMALVVVPVSGLLVAFALPAMGVVAFGGVTAAGVELMAAALASLAIGLFPYGAFLLLARAGYALGDSRTPAAVALATGLLGLGVMVALAPVTHGTARVAALGLGHSAAYLAGTVVLAAWLSRRTGRVVAPRRLALAVVLTVPLSAAGWAAVRALDPSGRMVTAAVLAGVGALLAGVYVVALRAVGAVPARRSAPSSVGAP